MAWFDIITLDRLKQMRIHTTISQTFHQGFQKPEFSFLSIIFLFRIMPKNKGQKRQGGVSKRSYARISLKRRKMLIQMVFKEGFSIARAIKKLSLKLTTARFIIQKFKESGTFPMKQFKKNARMLKDLPNGEPNIDVKLQDIPEAEPIKIEPLESQDLLKEQQKEGQQQQEHVQPYQQGLLWYCYQPYFYS